MEPLEKLERDNDVLEALRHFGLRERTKGFQYLSFVLTVLKKGNPFSNKLWDAAAVYFDARKESMIRCARREIQHAFDANPALFADGGNGGGPASAPSVENFIDMVMDRLDV